MKIKALIYCRVSSQRQVNEGHGLDSQEKRCKDFATSKGYIIDNVFPDEGISGGLFERPAMQDLISYMDAHPLEKFVVIFDDLARFARDVKVHIQLKTELISRGAKLECLNFNYDDSDESEMAELMLAVSNQYQRKANRRQVIQKMKARLERGYWCFGPPKGLVNKKDPMHGIILVSEEPYAVIYKEALEGFANGTFVTPNEVRLYIWEEYKKVGINREPSLSTVQKILRDPLYAGYLEYAKWDVSFKKAQHEGFISIDTYNTVQERLKQRSKPWKRKDWNKDFPLKPLVLCNVCSKALTASWNKGRSEYYPNYRCRQTKEQCIYGTKSINKYKIEGEFAKLLEQVKPGDGEVDLTKDVLIEQWSIRLDSYSTYRQNAKNEVARISAEITRLAKLAGNADDYRLVKVYEAEIKTLAAKQEELEEELGNKKYTDKEFGTATDKVFNALKKPLDMWQSPEYNNKRTILGIYFEDNLRYDYNLGFGTAGLSYGIELINEFGSAKSGDVGTVQISWNQIESYIERWFPVVAGLRF